ncbi:MAG: DNA polymerase III subunit gamma/tau [Chitinivibrionales bacterium]|nr:DNA polymerase III subunit gamma/tau [Chitinivibrionales bacterium]
MSYLVLARKWRPLTFEDVVGQEHVTRTLKLAIQKQRVAHAYIFSGTRGVGKTTTARILARALNCEHGPTPAPCGECTNCKNIISGSSFDVLEIDGASNNRVEDIRELRENVNYSSMGGKHRVYVIDEVHMLTRQAFNALLKTLEEPPKNVIFIFATTEPHKIPETIHSRCQRYDFRRISTEHILGRLEHICTSEAITFERSGLLLVARKADGSMRDGLSLLDQVYSFCQDSITEKEVRNVLGLVDIEVYKAVMHAIAHKDPAPVLKAVEDVLYRGFDLHEFLLGLEEHVRTLLFVQVPGILESSRIELNVDSPQSAQEYKEQTELFNERDLLRMTELTAKAENDIKWSAFPRFVVETTLLKMVFMDSSLSMEQLMQAFTNGDADPGTEVLGRIADPQKKKSEPSAPLIPASPVGQGPYQTGTIALPSSPPPTAEPVLAPEPSPAREKPISAAIEVDDSASFVQQNDASQSIDIREKWPAFLEYLMKERPNIASFLSLAYIVDASDTAIDVRFPFGLNFQFTEVTSKDVRDDIVKRLKAFCAHPFEVRITIENEPVNDTPKNDYTQHLGKNESSIENEIEKEPIIKTVLDMFDGKIVK